MHAFSSSLDFFKINFFSKKKISGIQCTITLSNSLDPDQARHFVGPDLGLNCLHLVYQQMTKVTTYGKWGVGGGGGGGGELMRGYNLCYVKK